MKPGSSGAAGVAGTTPAIEPTENHDQICIIFDAIQLDCASSDLMPSITYLALWLPLWWQAQKRLVLFAGEKMNKENRGFD